MSAQSNEILQTYSIGLVELRKPLAAKLAAVKIREDAEYARCRSLKQANKLEAKYRGIKAKLIDAWQVATLDDRRALRANYHESILTGI